MKKKYAEQRAKIKEEISYGNWNEFLRQKAEAGNMIALTILQSSRTKEKTVFKEWPVMVLLEGMTYTVDNEGNITYKLKDGELFLIIVKRLLPARIMKHVTLFKDGS